MKKNKLEREIRKILIPAMAEFATQTQMREFGSDLSDVTKTHTEKFVKLFRQLLEQQKGGES